jgi:hypothetical protein
MDELGTDVLHAEMQWLAVNRFSGIISSQLSEDTFNYAKNSNLLKGKRRFRRPQKAMGVVLAKKVISNVHKFKEVEIDSFIKEKMVCLPVEAFVAKPANASRSFKEIAGTNQTPTY